MILTKGCVPLDHSFPSLGLSLSIRKMRVGTTHRSESCLLRQPGAGFHGLALSHLPSGFLASTQLARSLHLCQRSPDSGLQTSPILTAHPYFRIKTPSVGHPPLMEVGVGGWRNWMQRE